MAINLSLITLDNVRDLSLLLSRQLTDVEEKLLELLMVKEDEEVIDDLRFKIENLEEEVDGCYESGFQDGIVGCVAIIEDEGVDQYIIDRVNKL